MYYWRHQEAALGGSSDSVSSPGRLAPTAWPPANVAEFLAAAKHGAKYTEAGEAEGAGGWGKWVNNRVVV